MLSTVMIICLIGGCALLLSAVYDSDSHAAAVQGSGGERAGLLSEPDVKETFPEYFRDQDPKLQELMVKHLRPWPEVYNYGNNRPTDPLATLLALSAKAQKAFEQQSITVKSEGRNVIGGESAGSGGIGGEGAAGRAPSSPSFAAASSVPFAAAAASPTGSHARASKLA